MPKKGTLICLVGPTAVGKTDLSLRIATQFEAEILSCDSRQMYRHIGIGTAKPSAPELTSVKHHFIDNLELEDVYSAGQFEKDAVQFLENYFKTNVVALCVGGSGLYYQGLVHGFDDLPSDESVRERLTQELESEGLSALQRRLKQLDPTTYESMDISNTQRLIRALEVCEVSGKPYSLLKSNTQKERSFNILTIGLNRDREELYERINHRVDLMLEEGLLEEVKSVFEKRALNSLQTVGYREIFGYLEGEYDLEEAIRLVKRNTRRFAKRQLTWFKRYEDIQWFHPKEEEKVIAFLKERLG